MPRDAKPKPCKHTKVIVARIGGKVTMTCGRCGHRIPTLHGVEAGV